MNSSSAVPVRRQNKSCDQCRAGKRRCDVQIKIPPGPSWGGHQRVCSSDDDKPPKPCSNCKKWKKTCTTEWLKSHHKQRSAPKKRQRSSKTTINEDPLSSNTGIGQPESFYAHKSEKIVPLINDYVQQFSSMPTFANPFTMAPISNVGSTPASSSRSNHLDAQAYSKLYGLASGGFVDPSAFPQAICQPVGDLNIASHCWSSPETYFSNTEYQAASSAAQISAKGKEHEQEHHNLPHSHVVPENSLVRPSGSPNSSSLLTENQNRLYIKKGLLKIYHDSLEGALSCWLNERNCPYTSRPFLDSNNTWGSRWGNRILARVSTLDDTYAKCNQVSANDQKEASNVLNLVVMAFAAQWSHAAFQSHGNVLEQAPDHGPFERNMQMTLWHKANLALCRASNNPSFKVIFASLVFAMTQRPMEYGEVLETSGMPGQSYSTSLRKIFELDTGSLFLDTALRKLHRHRRRLQDVEQAEDANMTQGLGSVKEEDKQTFGLLFWMAIMCDTLVAAMARRSFVINDADTNIMTDRQLTRRFSRYSNTSSCDLDGYSNQSGAQDSPYAEHDSQIWGNYFLTPETHTGELRKGYARWPCSYADAAACLTDATPVKVLLYRRVAQLQDLYYQRASPLVIEQVIASTLEVYMHWNNTYDCFITDCVANHESLPARIQSWYTLLACHWHYAVLIMADLIDKLDDSFMTNVTNRLTRQTTEFTSTLRFRSVYVISDIGRCSHYNSEVSFSQSPEFHHAVNRAALLTEPWTMILVRCFSLAGEVFVKVILSQHQLENLMTPDDLAQAVSRLGDCIEALRLLGRKSDMALNAAKVLQATLDQEVSQN